MRPFACAASLAAAGIALAASSLPRPDSVRPVEVTCTRDYSEGAVVDRDGSVFFSHGRVVGKVSPAGETTTWAETGAPNGHKILPNGRHLVCDGERRAVLELDAGGREIRVAAGSWNGEPLRMPNDLTLDGRGGFYFTDPGGSGRRNPIGSVYHADAKGAVTRLGTGFAFPNGIVRSKDGKRLYFGESERNRILVWDLGADGLPKGGWRLFADLPGPAEPNGTAVPDGIALDNAGRLWVAHYGTRSVKVLSRDGKLLAAYPAGNRTTSNLAFGGPKNDRLYVTGGEPGCLYRLDVGVPGLRLLPARRTRR